MFKVNRLAPLWMMMLLVAGMSRLNLSGAAEVIQNIIPQGRIGGATYASHVEATTAYVAEGFFATIADVSTPAQPQVLGRIRLPRPAVDVSKSGSYCYVADSEAGLKIVDVSNPAAPTLAGTFATTQSTLTVDVGGSIAYLGTQVPDLELVDVSNPSSPAPLGTFPTLCYDVATSGTLAFVAAGTQGLRILNVSTPATPTQVGVYGSSGINVRGVVLRGSLAFLASNDTTPGLIIVDVSNPALPIFVGSAATASLPIGITLNGTHATVGEFGTGPPLTPPFNGVEVFDISNPAAPALTGSYKTGG